jgi:hypothetical protein
MKDRASEMPFDVQQNAAGLRIDCEVVEDIAKADVGGRAERGDRREAEATRVGPVEQGGAEGAGLGDQRDMSGLRAALREGRVEPDAWVE